MGDWLKWLWYHRNYLIIVLTPLLALALPLVYPSSVSPPFRHNCGKK
ncbi:unnamed protein product [Ophioblennius macclurei]